MNTRKMTHGIIITAIVACVFFAAAFSGTKHITAQPAAASMTANLAKVDMERKAAATQPVIIAENQVPLAEAPANTDNRNTILMIVVAVSAFAAGIVICEELKDRRSLSHKLSAHG